MEKNGRKQSEAEFLRITLLSKSDEPIFFYSNLPLEEAAKDENFKKKWLLAIAMVLKKGLHLNMIHNIDRPISEMLLGIENWIPLYMTGAISPYYFKKTPSDLFYTAHYTSGAVALSSEYIKASDGKSRYYLTTKKEELEYYKAKSEYLLKKASPLMEIFKEDNKDEFKTFMNMQNSNEIKTVKKDCYKNIDFSINKNKWVMINKKTSPQMHFVIYNSKLRSAFETFLAK